MHKARVVFVVTRKEMASATIGDALLRTGAFSRVADNLFCAGKDYLYWHDEELVKATSLDALFDAQCFVFCYRHRSEKSVVSYSVHFVGNPTAEVWGSGDPEALGVAHPSFAAHMLRCLKEVASDGVQVTYEATHHGPTSVRTPLLFLELGSTEAQWSDASRGAAIAQAVLRFMRSAPAKLPVALGFGGGHYPDRFTRRALSGEYAFSHMFSKYAVEKGLSAEVVAQALERSAEPVDVALFDKSCGSAEQRAPILALLDARGIKVVKLK